MAKEIPGPSGLPFIGNVRNIDTGRIHASMYKLQMEYGGLYKISFFGKSVIVLGDRDIIEKAFNEKDICHRPNTYISWLMFNGAGYLDSSFTEKDLNLRAEVWKAITNAEKDKLVAKYTAEDLKSFLESLGRIQGDSPIAEMLTRTGAKQLAITLTGGPGTEEQVDGILAFLYSMKKIIADGKTLTLSALPWLRFIPSNCKRAVDAVLSSREKVTNILIRDSKKSYRRGEEHGILQHCLTSQKVENSAISDLSLKACIVDFLFNAVFPIGQNVAYVILQAIKYQEMQEKIHAELSGDAKEAIIDGPINLDDFPFTEAFILESMRYLTMVYNTAPHSVNEETVINGYRFPKGAIVYGNIFGIHHDEKLFSDPWEFKPDRFLDKSGRVLPESSSVRKSLIHFGEGLRFCQGKNMATERITRLTLGIFRRYKVLPPLDAGLPTSDPREYSCRGAIDLPSFSCRFEKK